MVKKEFTSWASENLLLVALLSIAIFTSHCEAAANWRSYQGLLYKTVQYDRQSTPVFQLIQEDKGAGILIRLTQRGVDELSSSMSGVVENSLSRMSFQNLAAVQMHDIVFDVTRLDIFSIRMPGNVRVTLRGIPHSDFDISADDIDLAFSVTVMTNKRFMEMATFDVDASDISFLLGISLRQSGESMTANLDSCQFDIRHVRVRTEETYGSRFIWNFARGVLRNQIRQFFQTRLCSVLGEQMPNMVKAFDKSDNLGKKFMGPNSAVNAFGAFGNQSASNNLLYNLKKNLAKLKIKKSLVSNPLVVLSGNTKWLEVALNGRVYADGVPSTLSGRSKRVANNNAITSSKMIYIGISDFVANSLFDTLYRLQAFTFDLNAKNVPQLKEFLQLECDTICMGVLLPHLVSKYYGQEVSLSLTAKDVPKCQFTSSGIRVDADALLKALVTSGSSKVTAMEADVTVSVMLKLHVGSEKLHGTAKIDKFSVKPKMKQNWGDMVEDMISEVPRQMVENKLNEILKQGVPLVPMHLFKLKNAKLVHRAQSLWIETDVQISHEELAAMLTNALRSTVI